MESHEDGGAHGRQWEHIISNKAKAKNKIYVFVIQFDAFVAF
nr:hypothetical protein [Weissella cibaria]